MTHCLTEGRGAGQARSDGCLSGMRIGMHVEGRPDGAGRSRDLGFAASGDFPFYFLSLSLPVSGVHSLSHSKKALRVVLS